MPITPCTKSGTYEIVPNIAIPTSAMQATLPATIGLRRMLERQDRLARASLDDARTPRAATAATTSAPTTCAARPGVVAGRPRRARAAATPVPAASTPGAEPVDRVLGARRAARHRQRDHDEREPADRQVDEEDPAPARVVDDEPADRRADDRRRRRRRRRSAPASGRGRAAGRCCRSRRARAGRARRRRCPGSRGRRRAASSPVARPQSAEPTRKTTIAKRNRFLRP